jgi:hypothetical protein
MPRPEPPKEHRWKKGQSGNPKGRPPKKSFQELVEKALDSEIKKAGIVKRELLAQLFVDRLLRQKNKEDFTHYIKRAWPEVAKHEISGDLDLNHEMQLAAEELEQILSKGKNKKK